jgi:hypothetical protein
MGRFVIGLIVGALGAAAIFAIDLGGFTLSPPLVAMAGGLLIGALLGWRNPYPGKALVSGLLTGGLAGLLMGIGQFVGVSQAVHLPHIPVWMRDISQYSPMYGWLTRGMGGLMLLLLAGIGGAFAGLLSAWTGLSPRAQAAAVPVRSAEAANLLPGPAE